MKKGKKIKKSKKLKSIVGTKVTSITTFNKKRSKTVITSTGDNFKTVILKPNKGKGTKKFYKGKKLLKTTKF